MLRNICTIRSRSISLLAPLRSSRLPFHNTQDQVKQHEKSIQFWKKIFIFVCAPALILSGLNVYITGEEPRPEFKPYEHLRIRTKAFPWGDGNKTLFHNSHRNALPEGYEADEH